DDDSLLPDSADELAAELEALLVLQETDMTLFYRGLIDVPLGESESASAEARCRPLLDAYYEPPTPTTLERLGKWLERYAHRARSEDWGEREAVMRRANPKL